MAATRDIDSGIRSVQRALDILNCFTWEKKELSLTEIASLIGLPKSTTSRMLSTLTTNGYLQRDDLHGKYRLGTRLFYLGSIVKESFELRTIAKPVMTKLRDETKETVNLYIQEGTRRVCIDQVEGVLSVRRLVRIGEQFPLWLGASGKVLLAYGSETIRQVVYREAMALTGNLNMDVLSAELAGVMDKGYAISHGEREAGVSSIAAPVFDWNGQVMAAITISGPTTRFTPEKIAEWIPLIIQRAEEISAELGWSKRIVRRG